MFIVWNRSDTVNLNHISTASWSWQFLYLLQRQVRILLRNSNEVGMLVFSVIFLFIFCSFILQWPKMAENCYHCSHFKFIYQYIIEFFRNTFDFFFCIDSFIILIFFEIVFTRLRNLAMVFVICILDIANTQINVCSGNI